MWLVHGLFSLAKLTKITEGKDANFVSCSEKVQRKMAILAELDSQDDEIKVRIGKV